MIADISWRENKARGDADEDIDGGMRLGVKSTSGLTNRRILLSSRSVGVLMDFDVITVIKDGCGFVPTNHFLFKKGV